MRTVVLLLDRGAKSAFVPEEETKRLKCVLKEGEVEIKVNAISKPIFAELDTE
jgi:hypothetical protein